MPHKKPTIKLTDIDKEKFKEFVPLESQETIKVAYENGIVDNIDVIVKLKSVISQKQYMVYTKNETDKNGKITIYISSLNRTDSNIPEINGVSLEERIKIMNWINPKPE